MSLGVLNNIAAIYAQKQSEPDAGEPAGYAERAFLGVRASTPDQTTRPAWLLRTDSTPMKPR